MKTLFKFEFEERRGGTLLGLFVSTEEEVNKLFGQTVSFDECLGKHSYTEFTISPEDVKPVSNNQVFIGEFNSTIGEFGYNPFNHLTSDYK